MKRLTILFLAVMLSVGVSFAIPAHKGTFTVRQPDGTTVTLRLHGDEYLHFNTTTDGYTVVSDERGGYYYAERLGDHLVATTLMAHDAADRSAAEVTYLNQTAKYQAPLMSATVASEQQKELARRSEALKSLYDYDNFRGLILLVEFNDRSFSRNDYVDVITDMVNKEDYTGYSATGRGRFTGSVRDYFYDNSNGVFSPEFDIVGPIKVDRSQYYPNGTSKAGQLTLDVINAADSLVNFKDYDRDGDGTVDMVFFVFAGLGSNIGGNDSRLIWPHAGQLFNPNNYRYIVKDGVQLDRYACSTELYGSESYNFLDGIGVISHEFSHVLGLPDLYDTDYEGGGGQSDDPSDWAIMASGAYLNYGRTPAGYTLYERYSVGFAQPQLISEVGSYELPPLGDSNQGFRMDTRVNKEFFLFENRQKSSKWDAQLPGHGLLVFRVDSTNTAVWNWNKVNSDPKHNYMELVRAGGPVRSGGDPTAAASDPFPGTKLVRTLNNVTTPGNLLTWSGTESPFGLEKIKESNGKVLFDVNDVNILRSISLPESVSVGKGYTYQLTETRDPDYAPYTLEWTSKDPAIATVDDSGLVTGVAIGETTVTVTANGDSKLSATCKIIVSDLPVVATIADFKALGADAEAVLNLTDAQVVFVNDDEGDIYLRDASGAIIFTMIDMVAEQGDIVNGSIYGRYVVEDRMPRFWPVENATTTEDLTTTKGGAVEPRSVELAQLTEACYADFITLKAVELERNNSPWTGIWVKGDHHVRLFNPFRIDNISVDRDLAGKYYDVTGIYHTNIFNNDVADEIAMTISPVQVEGPSAITSATLGDIDATAPVTLYTADGRLVARTTVKGLRLLQLKHGLYVVRSGDIMVKVVM